MDKTDEFEGLGLLACVVKKNVSVLNCAKEKLLAPVALFIFFVLLLIGAIAACYKIIQFLAETGIVQSAGVLFTGNPIMSGAVALILLFEIYCIVWCVGHRKQKRIEKETLDAPVCPLDTPVKKE